MRSLTAAVSAPRGRAHATQLHLLSFSCACHHRMLQDSHLDHITVTSSCPPSGLVTISGWENSLCRAPDSLWASDNRLVSEHPGRHGRFAYFMVISDFIAGSCNN
ncbi:hypothetical protein CDAR_229711 [Caerostris darwini]|uniref:Secreted protein n=1 Tax=Caerostris darwini TaxID=1538125 RepID=A0AAV4Q0Q2_9ARAC|nr:hypothetical protein CDAR_229711 [Caerostris darwini]